MSKIRLTESELIQIIKRVINEQSSYPMTGTPQGGGAYTRGRPLNVPTDPYYYAYENGKVYTRKKTESSFREVTNPVVNKTGDNKAWCAIDIKYGHILNIPDNTGAKYCGKYTNMFSQYTGKRIDLY
jgi:hypothetical protein